MNFEIVQKVQCMCCNFSNLMNFEIVQKVQEHYFLKATQAIMFHCSCKFKDKFFSTHFMKR